MQDQTAVLLLYSPVTLQYLVNLELVRSCSLALWFRSFVYSEVKLKPSLVSDDLLIIWGLYCLHKWNLFTSFNTAVPFPKWSHSGRDSFMIKRVWQLHCATGRRNRARCSEMRQEMMDDWWQTDQRRKSFENCLLVNCRLVLLPLGEFIWHFSSSPSWEWIFTRLISATLIVLFLSSPWHVKSLPLWFQKGISQVACC